MTASLSIGACGFLLYFVTIVMVLRWIDQTSPALLVIATSILIYVALLTVAVVSSWTMMFWPLSAAYWFLVLCFLMAFGAIYKSLSLRILRDLLDQSGWSESYDTIFTRYVQEESFVGRLQIVIANGWAIRLPNRIQLTARGYRIATTVYAVQKLFKIERSG